MQIHCQAPAFPPCPPMPGMVEPEAPRVGCLLVPRKESARYRHQAEALQAKVDELRAWHEYLEARERFIHLVEDPEVHEIALKAIC